MKKAMFTFLFSIGLLLNLAFDCCPNNSYWNLHSFQINVFNYKNGKKTSQSTKISTDTLALSLYLNANFMAEQISYNPLINNCQATSCDPYGGEKGMRDEIGQIAISGNSYLPNGQRTSQSLAATALINGQPISTWLANKAYNQLFRTAGVMNMVEITILLTEQPTTPIEDISIYFIMNSGVVVTNVSPEIVWSKNAEIDANRELNG